VLFNEPKLLNRLSGGATTRTARRFSALQRAEIAEIALLLDENDALTGFSALQRAEIAEIGR